MYRQIQEPWIREGIYRFLADTLNFDPSDAYEIAHNMDMDVDVLRYKYDIPDDVFYKYWNLAFMNR